MHRQIGFEQFGPIGRNPTTALSMVVGDPRQKTGAAAVMIQPLAIFDIYRREWSQVRGDFMVN